MTIAEYVARLLAEAPPLTEEQIDGAARILVTVEADVAA